MDEFVRAGTNYKMMNSMPSAGFDVEVFPTRSAAHSMLARRPTQIFRNHFTLYHLQLPLTQQFLLRALLRSSSGPFGPHRPRADPTLGRLEGVGGVVYWLNTQVQACQPHPQPSGSCTGPSPAPSSCSQQLAREGAGWGRLLGGGDGPAAAGGTGVASTPTKARAVRGNHAAGRGTVGRERLVPWQQPARLTGSTE